MLSKNLENSLSYGIFYKFWKKARVYYMLSISREGGRSPPPGFATDKMKYLENMHAIKMPKVRFLFTLTVLKYRQYTKNCHW